MTVFQTEKAKEKGARYVLQVHLVNRQTGNPAPSVFWEARTQVEAHEMLLTILAVYNRSGQPCFVEFATIETTKGKQVFARNLKNIYTHN
jgi:hypothetical protein